MGEEKSRLSSGFWVGGKAVPSRGNILCKGGGPERRTPRKGFLEKVGEWGFIRGRWTRSGAEFST
jgi:hypothetical protein